MASCPKCGQPMNYGAAQRCRTCVLRARRDSYQRGRAPAGSEPGDLVQAAKRADRSYVERLLPSSAPEIIRRALIAAAKYGQDAIVELLLSRAGDTETIRAALHAAVFYYHTPPKGPGHRRIVHGALRRVEDLGARSALASSELCLAAEAGAPDLVQALLDEGAQVDIFSAAALGLPERILALLTTDPGAAKARDRYGRTPLHYCAASALGNGSPETASRLLEVASLLVDHGADVCAADTHHPEAPWRMSPLTMTAWHGGDAAIARFLLEKGAAASEDFSRALWFALGHFQRHGDGQYDIAELLVGDGADLDANDGRTLLHALAHHGDARGVAWLLAHGAIVDPRDEEGRTPLHLAAERNDGPRVAGLLLDHGADLNARDGAGATPLQLAERNDKKKVGRLLRERGALE